MKFRDRYGRLNVDVVTCPCGFESEDTNLFRCPVDDRILGETTRVVPIFQYPNGVQIDVPESDVQVVTFTTYDLIFVGYVAGDCDLFRPYVEI